MAATRTVPSLLQMCVDRIDALAHGTYKGNGGGSSGGLNWRKRYFDTMRVYGICDAETMANDLVAIQREWQTMDRVTRLELLPKMMTTGSVSCAAGLCVAVANHLLHDVTRNPGNAPLSKTVKTTVHGASNVVLAKAVKALRKLGYANVDSGHEYYDGSGYYRENGMVPYLIIDRPVPVDDERECKKQRR